MGEYQARVHRVAKQSVENILPQLNCTVKQILTEFPLVPTEVVIEADDLTVCIGVGNTLTATVTGCNSSYQWQIFDEDWIDIEGKNSLTLHLDNEDTGSYIYSMAVTQSNGDIVYSNELTVVVSNTGGCFGNMTGTAFTNLGVLIQGMNLQLYEDFDHDLVAGTLIRSIFTNSSGGWAMASIPSGRWYLLVATAPLHTLTGASDNPNPNLAFDQEVDPTIILPNNNVAGREAISIFIKPSLIQGSIDLIFTLN